MGSKCANLAGIALIALSATVAGCDISDSDDGEAPPPRPAEKADAPAKLPPGWITETNRSAGFTIGVPPGWSVRTGGTSSVLTSPDKQVAISVSADRTDEALSIPLERFALGTAESLDGFKDLKVQTPMPYKAKYQGESVRAIGTLEKKNIRQRLAVVILRRDAIATYPILAAANTNKRTVFAKQIDPIVRSLRGRPVEVASTGA